MSIKKISRLVVCLALLIAIASPNSIIVKAAGTTEFYASFETSETTQALSNNIVDSKNMSPAMATAAAAGPNTVADPVSGVSGGRGWDGTRVLRVTGTQPAGADAYSTNLIYDNLEIDVQANTQLSYVILPDYGSAASVSYSATNWDWDFTSQYLCIDLEFTDGTRLSALGGLDQYGHPMTGRAQGSYGHLYMKQWNLVKCNVGEVAAGKTIKKILVNFDKPTNKKAAAHTFGAYIDYLRIKPTDTSEKATPVEYANIFVGNNDRPLYSRGNQWPSLMTPNGFNVWCPSNVPLSGFLGGVDYAGNKIFSTKPSAGITHITTSHQASCWVGDFGYFQFMPNTNYAQTNSAVITPANRRTLYDRDTMINNPSYFSVQFADTANAPAKGVKLELSPTDHAAMARMTFPADSQYVNVVFDSMTMASNQSTVSTVSGSIAFADGGKTFSGKTAYNAAEGRTADMYFYGEFDKTPSAYKAYSATSNARAMATFESGTTEVNMKLATSFISAAQAKKNLELEIASDATFDDVKNATAKVWNDLMGTAIIEGSEEEKVAFYSSVMRTYADPLLLSENVGTAADPVWQYASPYKGSNSTSRTPTEGYKLYYNNGFWDTFRGAWGTYGLLTPVKAGEMLNGLVQHYVDSNWLARWLAPGGRNSMVGTSSDIIFGDAVAKGVSTFDYQNAYMASLKNASAFAPNATSANVPVSSFAGRAGMDAAPYVGYTVASDGKGLSWSIDNYLNDFGVYHLAKKLGKNDEAIYFKNTAQHFVNLWNYSGGGWFIGKNTAGAWNYPNGLTFNTSGNDSAYFKTNPYEETNGFTMTFSALADMRGLTNLYGGKDKLAARLDRMFTDEAMYTGAGRDMFVDFYDTKLGNYGHGNQPDFHIPYVYTYAGQPYKTQKYTRDICERVYAGASFDQLFPGDQDNGSTSGWYVMSALGFFPFSSGLDGYIITSPLFDKITLNLPSGKIEIICNNNSHDNVYIQSMTIDGVPYNSSYITTKDLLAAKRIVFEMGPNPSNWACESEPPSITPADSDAVPNPLHDFTTSGISCQSSLPTTKLATEWAYVSNITTAGAAALFNNTNAANAPFTASNSSIYYYFPSAKKVEMVTLTSGITLAASNAPNSLSLYGSNDGINWTLLESRSEITFDWARQLKPFAITNASPYYYYRLDLEAVSTLQISEIELMGYPLNIIKMFKTADNNFIVNTENSVSTLWMRDANFTRVTANATVSTASVNADGTKTFTISGTALDSVKYLTAQTGSGYEITASRKDFKTGNGVMLYKNGSDLVALYNNSNNPTLNHVLIIAVYNSDDKLVKIDSVNEATDLSSISIDSDAYAGCTFKAFAFDSNFVPIFASATL